MKKNHKPALCFCGKPMLKRGYGQYPYDCDLARKYPQAMIYAGCTGGHTGWIADIEDISIVKINQSLI